MATWTLTGALLQASGSDLTGDVALSGVQPADFNPDAITQIRMSRTLVIAGLDDDSWMDHRSGSLVNASGQTVASVDDADINRAGSTANGSYPWTGTVSGNPADKPDPSGNVLRAPNGNWATFSQNMKADATTADLASVIVEIDYTPGAPPAASFTKDKDTIYVDQSVQFTDTSTGGVTSRSWDFGGGAASSSQANPLVTFTTPGVYNVRLTATNAFGSNQSAPQAVTVLVREAEIWNGSAWVGGESWNGSAWVTPEVWDGTQWIPVKTP